MRILILLSLLWNFAFAQNFISSNQYFIYPKIKNPCEVYNALNTIIRDGLQDTILSKKQFAKMIPQLHAFYKSLDEQIYDTTTWVFPVKGKQPVACIGGRHGEGFRAKGFNHFDIHARISHPAHDLFIRDKNNDGIDDKTKQETEILSMTGGIVVALEKKWRVTDTTRGGNYIWVYEPFMKALVYYAHNKEVFVNLGDIVKPGQKIAIMGRTGLNAYKKRSPTHLHLSFLVVKDGKPIPFDSYKLLLKSKVVL